MATHRVRRRLPTAVDASVLDEELAHRIAASMMKGMAETFGAIERQDGSVVWFAYDWTSDGTYVALSIDPSERSVDLYLDTRGLERPHPPSDRRGGMLIAGVAVAAVAVGLFRQSAGLGFGLFLVLPLHVCDAVARRVVDGHREGRAHGTPVMAIASRT